MIVAPYQDQYGLAHRPDWHIVLLCGSPFDELAGPGLQPPACVTTHAGQDDVVDARNARQSGLQYFKDQGQQQTAPSGPFL